MNSSTFADGDLNIRYTSEYNITLLHAEILRRLKIAESRLPALEQRLKVLKKILEGRPSVVTARITKTEIAETEARIAASAGSVQRYLEATRELLEAFAKLGPRRTIIGAKATEDPRRLALVEDFLKQAGEHVTLQHAKAISVISGCLACGCDQQVMKGGITICAKCGITNTGRHLGQRSVKEEFLSVLCRYSCDKLELPRALENDLDQWLSREYILTCQKIRNSELIGNRREGTTLDMMQNGLIATGQDKYSDFARVLTVLCWGWQPVGSLPAISETRLALPIDHHAKLFLLLEPTGATPEEFGIPETLDIEEIRQQWNAVG